jgi:hypothetical protein
VPVGGEGRGGEGREPTPAVNAADPNLPGDIIIVVIIVVIIIIIR